MPRHRPVLAATLVATLLLVPADGGVIYTESFLIEGKGPGEGLCVALDEYGWENCYNSRGRMLPGGRKTMADIGIANARGAPDPKNSTKGYLADNHAAPPGGNRNFLFTQATPVFVLGSLRSIDFYTRNDRSADRKNPQHCRLAFAVQINGGTWYRTELLFGEEDRNWNYHSISRDDLTLQKLQPILFRPGKKLNGGGPDITHLEPEFLPGDAIVTGIGFYGYQRGTFRVDEITITTEDAE